MTDSNSTEFDLSMFDSQTTEQPTGGFDLSMFDAASGPVAESPEVNTSFAGDVVDLLQGGAAEGLGGVLDFIGADSAAQSLYDIAEEQHKTLTPETRESMGKDLFSEEGEYYLGEGAEDIRNWAAKTLNVFGMMATPVPGGALVSGGVKLATGLTKAANVLSKTEKVINEAAKLGVSPKRLAKDIVAKDNKFKDYLATTAGYGGMEGATSAGLTEKQIRENVLGMDQATLEASEPYQEALAQTGDPQSARQMVADTLSKEGAWKTFFPTAVLGAGAGRFYDDLFRGAGTGSRAKNALAGGATEAMEEMPQGLAESVAQNTTLQQVDPTIGTFDNAIPNMLEGGALGFGTGAGFGLLSPSGEAVKRARIDQAGKDALAKGGDALDAEIAKSKEAVNLASAGDFGPTRGPLQAGSRQQIIDETPIDLTPGAVVTPEIRAQMNQAELDRNDVLRAEAYKAAGIATPDEYNSRHRLRTDVAGSGQTVPMPQGSEFPHPGIVRPNKQRASRNFELQIEGRQAVAEDNEKRYARIMALGGPRTDQSRAFVQWFERENGITKDVPEILISQTGGQSRSTGGRSVYSGLREPAPVNQIPPAADTGPQPGASGQPVQAAEEGEGLTELEASSKVKTLDQADANTNSSIDRDINKNLPKNTVAGGAEQISQLVGQASAGGNKNSRVRYAVVAPEEASNLKQATGLDLDGYKHTVDLYGIRHAIKEHGDQATEERRGQLPVTERDFALIPEIVSSPDEITLVGKDATGSDLIRYKKRFNGTTYYVEEVRAKRKELVTKTLWKTRTTLHATPEGGGADTSETIGRNLPELDNSIAPDQKEGKKSPVSGDPAPADRPRAETVTAPSEKARPAAQVKESEETLTKPEGKEKEAAAKDGSPEGYQKAILNTPKKAYLKDMARAAGINKKSPGYKAALADLEMQYESELDRAYAELPFEEYNVANSDIPESLNRQVHAQLRMEHGIAPESSKSNQANSSKPTKEAAQTDQGVALLSLGTGKNFSPVSLSTARSVVDRIIAANKKRWNVSIDLAPTFDALPDEVKQAVAKYGKDTKGKGVLHKGTVYVVADLHESAADIETTILHEVTGHVGVRRLYGKDIVRSLNRLYASIGGRKGLTEIAKKRGIAKDLAEYAEMLGQSEFTDDVRVQIMMEEALAHLAESPKFGDRVKAIVGSIRQWLRDRGFAKLAEYGETDLLHILAQGRKQLKRIKAESGETVLMVGTINDSWKSGLEVSLGSSVSEAANTWLEMAKNDAVFSYPRSEAKDFAAIMADVAPDKIIEEQDVRSADITSAWKVWPKSRNGFGYVIEYPDGNVQVSLKHYQPVESGSEIYAAAGNYAHNNGLKFSADIHGVGRTGNVRRIENLISLALKFRTTDFIQPFGKKADQWVEGDTAHNLQLMMEESYANAIEQYPDIKGYRFDPETNRITPRPVERQEMGGSEQEGKTRDSGNGKRNGPGLGRTKRRAIITGYLLGRGGESGAGSVLLENSQIGDFAGSLYSRERGEGAAGAKLNPEYAIFGMPVDEIEATIGPITRAWTNAPDVVVAETMDDPRIPEAVRADNQRQMSQGATGDVEGFIHNGTVYLVAENLRSPKDAVRVLLHEAVGHAGLQVFGKRLERILDQIAKARPDEVAAKAEEYGLDMNTLKARRMAAEEVLAEMAQTRPDISFVRQAVAAIRAWLRQHVPGFKDMKLTDDEIIQQFLIPARDFIESGRKTKGDSTKAFGVPDVAYSKDDKAWLRDAAMLWSDAAMDEDLFQNKASDKKSMQDIAEDAESGLVVEDYKSGEYPNAVKEWIIRMPTEGGTLPVFVRENKDGTIEMNASRLQEGKSRGSMAYHIVANYAHNNGKVFKGDTEGLSDVARVRRTENMLSSALKFRTTRHLRPHVKQNMAWEEGNDFANFVSLVERHYANIIDAVPEIKEIIYDPAEQDFINSRTGKRVGQEAFEGIAADAGRESAEGIGPTTLKRAAFTNTLSQGESREVRRRLLGYVAQQLHKGIDLPTTLKGIQYSRTQDTDNTSSSGERNREISPIREGIRDRVDAFRFQMQDKLIDLKRKQQEIEGDPDSDPITDASNAYQKAAIWEGRAGERLNDFDEGQVQPLLEQVAETGLDWDTVGEWLVARHAEEANAYLYEINPDMEEAERSRLSGMSNDEADAILSEHADNASLQRVGEMVDSIGRRRVDELVADGLISQEMADAWRGRYEHYVPLKREEAESSDYLPARGQGFHLAGKASKQRTGSAYWTPSKILTNFLTQAQAGIVKGEKNRVGNALLNLVEQHPDQDFWAVDVDKTRREVRKLKSGNKVIEVPDNRIDDNELAVWRDGERHIIVFNRSNDRAMRLVSGLKNLQAGQMGKVMSAMSKVIRYLASINTSWNPEFIISNFFRDVQTAAYNLSDTDLSNMETRVLKDIPKAMNGIRSALFGDGSADWSRHWEDFRKHGGKTGWIDLHHDLNEVESDLKKQVERLKSGKATKSAWTRFFKRVDDLNMVVENGVRLSAYKNAVDAGISPDKAAALAKDLTVNFNRKGQLGPQINALYMFYNAGIQGSVRMLQAMVNSSKGRKLAVATIGFAITLDIVNRALSGEDDDGENLYDNINDHEKNHYLIIMGEKKPIAKIMLPWGYNVLHVIGQTIGEAMTSKRFDALKSGARLANAAVDAFNPVGSSTVIQTLSPTIIDPAVQIAENRAWHGGPLKPEHTFDSRAPRPEYQMHWASAGETYKEAAKWMNDMTGGNAVRPGWTNVSPEILEMLFETATGGTGRTAMNTLDTVQKLIDGKPLEPKKTPFLRKVTGSMDEYGVKARYYEWSRDVAYAKSELGKLSGDDLEEARARPATKLVGFYSSTERQLRKLRKQRRLAEKSGQSEERIEAIDKRIREVMARFNRLYADKVLN